MTVMPDKITEESPKLRWRVYPYNAPPITSAMSTWQEVQRSQIVAVVWQRTDMTKPQPEVGTPYYYAEETFVARCWDPSLYLRKLGVKMGRWADPQIFNSAWYQALAHVSPPGTDADALFERAKQGGQIVSTEEAADSKREVGWRIWCDDLRIFSSAHSTWESLPADGVMCVAYTHLHDGLLLSMAKRRFTFYFWAGEVLCNTDSLSEVLAHFPQFKYGITSFDGLQAYLPMAELIRAALNDTLEDVPYGP
jgi:hypothetical protein